MPDTLTEIRQRAEEFPADESIGDADRAVLLRHIDTLTEAHDKFEEYANRAIADRTEELLVLHKRIDAMTAAVRAVVDSWDCILPLSYSEQEVVAEKVAALQRILEEPKRE